MKLLAIISTLGGILCSSFATAADTFISIGTGGQTGVYYIAGQSICRFVNRTTDTHQIKCNAPTSGGGVANVNGLRSLEYNFGIMQSDHQFKALNGLAPFQDHGKMTDIRAVFSLQSEVFTILAREDSGIHSFEDLKNKRVNLGNPGSGQRDTFEQILAVKNWNSDVFSLVSDLKPAEQAPAMSDNKIDAMSYFVGHPNGAIQEASTTTDTRLIPVTGPEIDALLKEKTISLKQLFLVACTAATQMIPCLLVAKQCYQLMQIPILKWCIS